MKKIERYWSWGTGYADFKHSCVPCPSSGCPKPIVLAEEPPEYTMASGAIVYVDDGSCYEGLIKRVTGGSQNSPRKYACVLREGIVD